MGARKRKVQSSILASVHKTAAGLHKAGIMDKATMHEFDSLCRRSIATVDLTEEEIEEMTSGRMDPKHDHLNSLLEGQ